MYKNVELATGVRFIDSINQTGIILLDVLVGMSKQDIVVYSTGGWDYLDPLINRGFKSLKVPIVKRATLFNLDEPIESPDSPELLGDADIY